MNSLISRRIFALMLLMFIAWGPSNLHAAYVAPTIGGGQVGMMDAPMIHYDVNFDGTTLTVSDPFAGGHHHGGLGHEDIPLLRPLTPPAEFHPAATWYTALTGKAYNWQYAWNPDPGFNPSLLSAINASIWIKRLSHDAGLQAYDRQTPITYNPIFTSAGEIWKWNGGMVHNAFAVLNPLTDHYHATYEVYLGDEITGTAIPGYNTVEVTWTLHATVIPEPATLSVLALGSVLMLGRFTRHTMHC